MNDTHSDASQHSQDLFQSIFGYSSNIFSFSSSDIFFRFVSKEEQKIVNNSLLLRISGKV